MVFSAFTIEIRFLLCHNFYMGMRFSHGCRPNRPKADDLCKSDFAEVIFYTLQPWEYFYDDIPHHLPPTEAFQRERLSRR